MAKPDYLAIKCWAKYQHYKDRSPPWIKLHVDILASEDWVTLADASKLLMTVCMVIAAKNNDRPGHVPNNPDYIKRIAYLDRVPDLTPLIKCGFLVNPLADDSKPYQPQADATPETYRTDSESHSQRAKGSRLAPDWKPSAEHFNLGSQLNLVASEVDAAAGRFREYFLSPDATRPVKKDWDGAFNRWLRTDAPKIIANRARGQRPIPNQNVRGSVTAARDSILAKAGIQPTGDGDNQLRVVGGSRSAGDRTGGEDFGPIIDADFRERSPGIADGDEGSDTTASGADGGGFGGPTGSLSEADCDLSSGRSALRADEAGEREPVVALMAGATREAGDAHLPQTDDADGLEIPGFLKRT